MAGKEREFKSTTEEVKYHILKMLGDGMEHSRNEIMEYVRGNVRKPETVTENMFTGAVKSLTGNQTVDTVARGIYKLKAEESVQLELKEKVKIIMENCRDRLNDVCCINILEVSEAEMDTAKQVKQFIGSMDKMLETLMEKKSSQTKKEKTV